MQHKHYVSKYVPAVFAFLVSFRYLDAIRLNEFSSVWGQNCIFTVDTYFRIVCSIKLKIRKCFLKIIGHSAIELKAGEKKRGKKSEIRVKYFKFEIVSSSAKFKLCSWNQKLNLRRYFQFCHILKKTDLNLYPSLFG